MEEKTKPSPIKQKAIDAVVKREGEKLEPIPVRRILHSREEKKPFKRILHSDTRRMQRKIFDDKQHNSITQGCGE